MEIFGILINLIFLALPIYGLFAIVKKEAMEIEKNAPAGEAMNEKSQPAFHLFLYLASFFSLGFLISGIISVYFELVNKYVPDVSILDQFSSGSVFDDAAVKYGLSSLLIAAIVYFPVSFLINKKLAKGEIRADSLVRKFLTYIALFILTAITIGSLAVLFYDYLNGELTGNAFGKIIAFFLTVLFFAAFYFWEIRRKEFLEKPFKMFYGAALAVALSGLIVGLAIADSPTVAREKKIDSSMINEMESMKNNIEDLYDDTNGIPTEKEIQKSAKFKIDYIVKNEKEYQMCANFLRSQEENNFDMQMWNHPSGNYCFTFNIESREGEVISIPAKPAK